MDQFTQEYIKSAFKLHKQHQNELWRQLLRTDVKKLAYQKIAIIYQMKFAFHVICIPGFDEYK